MGGQLKRSGRSHRGWWQRRDPVRVVQSGLRSGSGARRYCDQRSDFDRLEENNDQVNIKIYYIAPVLSVWCVINYHYNNTVYIIYYDICIIINRPANDVNILITGKAHQHRTRNNIYIQFIGGPSA